MTALQQMQLQRAEYESFLKTFKQLPDSLEVFNIDNWNNLVEYATVYSADDIRFTFKNGQEIKAYMYSPTTRFHSCSEAVFYSAASNIRFCALR